MAKITYASLKLKKDTSTKTINLEDGKTLEILQYLPFEEKRDLIDIVLQKSEDGGQYNPLYTDMYFHLFLVYAYTNITFTEKQKEKEEELYDVLHSSGLLGKILECIPQEEYDYLLSYLEESLEKKEYYASSFVGGLLKFIEELPKKTTEAGEIAQGFNPEDFKEVFNFVKAINGTENK